MVIYSSADYGEIRARINETLYLVQRFITKFLQNCISYGDLELHTLFD